jgi:hypothetical protein
MVNPATQTDTPEFEALVDNIREFNTVFNPILLKTKESGVTYILDGNKRVLAADILLEEGNDDFEELEVIYV